MARDLQENNVPSENQIQVMYEEELNTGIKIMFVGNSITKHEPKPSIGWYNECGMEASCREKDYVHLLHKKIREVHPDASFALLQASHFEREFETFDIDKYYKSAIDFDADIIVLFFGANARKDYDVTENPDITFGERYKVLRDKLNKSGKAKVAHVQGFYLRERLNQEKLAVSNECGDVFIELGDIRTDEKTHGHFNHPNDYGMEMIAEKIWPTIKEWL